MRHILLLFALVMTFSFLRPSSVRAALPGDTDGDGVVSINEVQKVINVFLGLVYDDASPISIAPGAVSYGRTATFTVTGSHLDLGISATASGACTALVEQAGGTAAARTYTCTPSVIGPLNVAVSSSADGRVLRQTTVTVPQPQVTLSTSSGTIVVELQPDKAPATVNNFLQYARDGFYANTIFHRVVSGFVIQGGGYGTDGSLKATRSPIRLEAPYVTGLTNAQGTIAMARTSVITSATAQFFINTVNNAGLDQPDGQGYAVFGNVVQGMDVVKTIEAVAVNNSVPVSMITVYSAAQTR